jgi:nucleoside-diphosphate kinase
VAGGYARFGGFCWLLGDLAAGGTGRYKRRGPPAHPLLAIARVRGFFLKDDAMAAERTFSILKPDATARNLTGAINAMIEQAGLRIVAQRRIRMSRQQAEKFYEVHKERPFYGELVDFMTSGPVVVQVLEGDNAVAKYREVMGATDPAKAAPGTIRKAHAVSVGENSVHGSDAADTAAQEIAQFFSKEEIVG